MDKELIYDIMNGFIDLSRVETEVDMPIIDEFSEGMECAKIYEEVYQAKLNLGERLGVSEDEDVEQIICGMGEITRILCLKMFDYGMKQAQMKMRGEADGERAV